MSKTIAVSEENYNRLTRLAGEIQFKEAKVKSPNDAINFLFNNQKG
jgi:predicted CopG family antitoxin